MGEERSSPINFCYAISRQGEITGHFFNKVLITFEGFQRRVDIIAGRRYHHHNNGNKNVSVYAIYQTSHT